MFSFETASPNGPEEKIFFKSTNQKQELHLTAMFANRLGRKVQLL
jgi:hypothetical protein